MRILHLCLVLFISSFTLFAQHNDSTMKTWNYPFPVHYFSTSDQIQLAYVDQGKGEQTLLFIHGLGSNLQAWKKNIEGLSSSFRCIALDLPGYGKSSQEDYPFSMSFFASEIADFIRGLELEEVILVGHSMGGQIAIHLSLSQPELVSKLILLAPAGIETFTEQEANWLKQVYNAALIKASPEQQIIRNFEMNFYKMPDDARFMINDRLALRKDPAYDYYCEMVPQCVAAMLDEPVFEQLSKLQPPTLVAFGENDQLIPNTFLHKDLTTIKVTESAQEKMPEAQVELIPKAGHFLQWEQSDKINKLIQTFLKTN